jgi:putative Ca2+/H+ antiporter (TMEM165/GDT1 family)
MTDAGFLEVVTVAFVAQLAVLPGEKAQFVIAGLSTRFDPKLVVGAAATAFAGWTALEILLGEAIQGLLPGVWLEVSTAAMFVVFAVLLVRSAPASDEDLAATDGGVVGADGDLEVRLPVVDWRVPNTLGGFLPILAMMTVGEFGDKTQVITITLAANYGASPAIWTGEMLAIVPVSLANAYFFHAFSHRFDLRKAHYAGAALFAFFAADTLLAVITGAVLGEPFSVWETVVSTAADLVLGVA